MIEFLPLLPPDEQEKYKHFGSERRRREFLSSRLLVRHLLAGYLNKPMESMEFGYLERGKPFVEGAELHFNLSHTDGLIACSFGWDEVGIDVEKADTQARPNWRLLAKRYFLLEEQNFLNGLSEVDQPITFFRIFTAKEALGKATGRGINFQLNDCNVPLPPVERARMGQWEFFSKTINRDVYCMAQVTNNPTSVPLRYQIRYWGEESLMDFLQQDFFERPGNQTAGLQRGISI